jgi:hypothetical protein
VYKELQSQQCQIMKRIKQKKSKPPKLPGNLQTETWTSANDHEHECEKADKTGTEPNLMRVPSLNDY